MVPRGGRVQTFNIIDLALGGTLDFSHSFLMFLFRVSHQRTGDACYFVARIGMVRPAHHLRTFMALPHTCRSRDDTMRPVAEARLLGLVHGDHP
jgi:hypothetical protein